MIDTRAIGIRREPSRPALVKMLAQLGGMGLIGLALLTYLPFAASGFVGSDSLPLIETSRMRGLTDALAIFSHPVMDGTAFTVGEVVYRPFVSLTFGLDYALWGLNAVGYHLTNIALHLIGTALFWQLLRRLGLRPWSSLFGAAVFALHPAVVASLPVIARRDSLLPVTAFTAAWLLLPVTGSRGARRTSMFVGSLTLTAIALVSKESAFVAVALLPVLLALGARSDGIPWRGALGRSTIALPHLALGLLLFAVRAAVLGGRLGGQTDPSQAVGGYSQVVGAYARDLTWSFAGVASSAHAIWPTLAVVLVAGCGAACVLLPSRQAHLTLMGLCWITGFGVFAMILRIATVGWLAYFALPGLALLWAAALEGAVAQLGQRAWRPRRVVSALLVLVLGALGLGWLSDSALVRNYEQWEIAGNVVRRYVQELDECVATAPYLTHVRLEGVPTVLDDGAAVTSQLGVTLFEDYTIQAALQLLFPDRDLTFTVWSRQTLRDEAPNMRFACSADTTRVSLTAIY